MLDIRAPLPDLNLVQIQSICTRICTPTHTVEVAGYPAD